MHHLKIIPAAAAQLREIELLARRIWPGAYGKILSREQIDYMLERMYAPEILLAEYRNGTCFDFLMRENQAIGFIAYGPPDAGRIMKLHKLYLLPEHHGRGFGAAALRHVIAQGRKLGCRAVILTVNKRNARALKSYQGNGFKIIDQVVTPFGNGFVMDDYIMCHDL